MRLSWDNSNGEIRVYKDRKKIERIGNGEAFRWTGGKVHVEGVGLSSPSANRRPEPIVLVAEALDDHGQVIKRTPLAARRVEVLVGPILKKLRVEPDGVPSQVGDGNGEPDYNFVYGTKPPRQAATFFADFVRPTSGSVAFVQTMRIENTLEGGIGGKEQRSGDQYEFGYSKREFLGETVDYFGQTLIDSDNKIENAVGVPFYHFIAFPPEPILGKETWTWKATDTPAMGVADDFRTEGRATQISVTYVFDLFIVQKLDDTIYTLGKANWSATFSGKIMGEGPHPNNAKLLRWRWRNEGSVITGGTGVQAHGVKPGVLLPPVVNDVLNWPHPDVDNGWRDA